MHAMMALKIGSADQNLHIAPINQVRAEHLVATKCNAGAFDSNK